MTKFAFKDKKKLISVIKLKTKLINTGKQKMEVANKNKKYDPLTEQKTKPNDKPNSNKIK